MDDGRRSTGGGSTRTGGRPASYQAVLRGELTRTMGLEWGPVRQGIAELDGIPSRVLRAFSRRRAEIEAALAERGASGPRAAEAAALATRRAKDLRLVPEVLASDWRRRAAELGLTPEYVTRLVGRSRRTAPDRTECERAMESLASPMGLTRKRSTFSRRDVVQGLCEALRPGSAVDARALETRADEFLASSRVVPLVREPADDDCDVQFRRRDGRLMPALREELVYSTPELLALE